jgi:hypothetical protein
MKMSEREKQWLKFSDRVVRHLREYTVPQYGDVGDDEITNYSVEDCVKQVEKYAKRYGSQSREGQQELDFIKIAHYVQCAWDKHENGEPKTQYGYELIGFTIEVSKDLLEQDGLEFVGSFDVEGETNYFYRRNK